MNINYYKIKMGIGQPVIITLQILAEMDIIFFYELIAGPPKW